jgi:hypothetical protein
VQSPRTMHFSSALSSQPVCAIALLLCTITPTPALSSANHAPALSVRDHPNLPLPVEVIHEFPPGTWLENIAVRRNGQILTTVTTAPEIYQVDPCKQRDPILLYSFPATSATGLAELQPDVFYVATGNTSSSGGQLSTVPGSFAVWKVDLRSFSVRHGKPAQVSKVATIPDARGLNGVAVLDHRKGLLLMADSLRGLIWRLNVHTGEVKIFTDDPLTKAPPSSQLPIGINGIKVRNGAVYFTNTDRGIIARLNIKNDGTPEGPAVVVVKGIATVDDFVIGPNGAFFPALILSGALSYAPATGGDAEIIANMTANPTAVAFGRRPEDAQSVYLSSAGGPLALFASKSPPRGKILKVDVTAFLNGHN